MKEMQVVLGVNLSHMCMSGMKFVCLAFWHCLGWQIASSYRSSILFTESRVVPLFSLHSAKKNQFSRRNKTTTTTTTTKQNSKKKKLALFL